MATYKALPSQFPSTTFESRLTFATWFIGLTTLAIYAGLVAVSDSNIMEDTVYSVGIAIMTYYTVVAVSSVVCSGYPLEHWRTALEQSHLPAIGPWCSSRSA